MSKPEKKVLALNELQKKFQFKFEPLHSSLFKKACLKSKQLMCLNVYALHAFNLI